MELLDNRLRTHNSYMEGFLAEIPPKHYLVSESESDVGPWIGAAKSVVEKKKRKERQKENQRSFLLFKFDPTTYKTIPELQTELKENGNLNSEMSFSDIGTSPFQSFLENGVAEDEDEEDSDEVEENSDDEDDDEEDDEDDEGLMSDSDDDSEIGDVSFFIDGEAEEDSEMEESDDEDEDEVEDDDDEEEDSDDEDLEEDSDDYDEDSDDEDEDEEEEEGIGAPRKKRKVSYGENKSGWVKGEKGQKKNDPERSKEELRLLVQQRISELRTQRKASNVDQEKKKDLRKRKREQKVKARKEKKKAKQVEAREKKREEEKKKKKGKGEDEVLSFGAFNTQSGKPVPTYLAKNDKKKTKAKTLLQKIEEEKKRLSQLEGSETGARLKREKDWEKSIMKAEGKKIKDDPALLRKTIRKEKQKKARSVKKWADRKKTETKQQQDKQKRRTENIQKKVQEKKDRKMGKGKKKKKGGSGGSGVQKRAGFEGKKRKFLNK